MTSGVSTSGSRTDTAVGAEPRPRGPASGTPAIAHIAAGVDGFPEGQDAAALGQLLARATGAELMLVTVLPAPLLRAPPNLSHRSLRRESELSLREVRESLAPGARRLTATDHSVARALHRVVQLHHRDLLVMGSSRKGPDERVRIGKRTRQLLCHVTCPLAVAPRGLHAHPPARLRRIGVGYDGGPESAAAVAVAAAIAIGAGAELRLHAVVDDRLPAFARSALLRAIDRGWNEVIAQRMDDARHGARATARPTGAEFDVTVARGRPADALLALSERVDLIVIGSRRWGPAARLLLGSTGEALMHDAACSVLAVPRPTS
jgi:nucleotide-binding universal stress UspA family protein